MIFLLLLILGSFASSNGSHSFCINRTVEEVKNHFVQLSEKIELGKTQNVCKFVGYRWKSKEKRKCDAAWFPDVLGKMGWYPENVDHPTNYDKMKQKNAEVYSIGVGPYIEWYGNAYLDFEIYDTFFHKGDEVLINGTYLETGGADGVISSNTLFFDRFLNWKGILIEPTICAKVQIPFNRPRATTFQGGICGTNTTLSVADMRVFCPEDGGYQDWDIPVRCSPLSAYMEEGAASVGKTIDFMSIDIEGHFMNALKSIPWDTFNIRVLVVECTHGVHSCKEYLESKGYHVLALKTAVHNVDDDVLAWKNDC